MAKTYLQLVNSVRTRLRDDNAVSVSDSPVTLLIGEFVNEAKEWVEDAHSWTSLRQTIQITTSAGIFAYSLTGAGNRSNIIQVINDTTDFVFGDASSYEDMNFWLTQNNSENQEPAHWDLNGIDANGDPIANLYPKPDQVYVINFNLTVPQDTLSTDSTELIVPHTPVILYATALGIEERGEEGGSTAERLFLRADEALTRAIILDQATTLDENILEIT